MGTKDVHDGNRSRDGLEGKEGGHGDHGSSSVLLNTGTSRCVLVANLFATKQKNKTQLCYLTHLDFNIGITSIFFFAELSLQTKVVEVQVTGSLGGDTTEVVARVSDGFTFACSNESKDGTENGRFVLGESGESGGPVITFRGTREVQSQTKGVL